MTKIPSQILSAILRVWACCVFITNVQAAEEDDRKLGLELQKLAALGSDRVLEIFDANQTRGVATIVSEDGYLIGKQSDLAQIDEILIRLGSKKIPPRLVELLPSLDLVVIKVPAHGLDSISWKKEEKAVTMGDWLVSVGSKKKEASLGVVSAKTREIKPSRAALGIRMSTPTANETGVGILGVVPNSPAQRAGLAAGDKLLSIDNENVASPADVKRLITASAPGQAIVIEIERKGRRFSVSASLEDASILGNPMETSQVLNGRTSLRRVDFPQVIQHDTPLSPDLMGGALLDLDGNFVGINIARVNRFTTYALPAHVFADAVQRAISEDRQRRAAARGSLLVPIGPQGSAKNL